MKLGRKLHFYTLIMVGIGAGALALGGESLAFLLATAAICLLNWLWFVGDNRKYLSDWIATAICGLAFAFTLVRLPGGYSPIGILYVNVPRAGEFLLIVQWALLFRRKTGRDYAFIFLLNFMLVVCSSLLVPDIIFVLGFIALLFVGQCALSLLHVALEEERAGRPIEQAAPNPAWRTDGRFLRRRAATTLAALVPIAVIFAVMPRGDVIMPLRPIALREIAALTALTGFADTVSTGSIANVIESTDRVMEVTVTINGANAGKDYPLLMRGTALTDYEQLESDWVWMRDRHYLALDPKTGLRGIYSDDFREYFDEEGDRVDCDIWLEPLDTHILFAPFAVEKVNLVSSFVLRASSIADSVETRYARPTRVHYQTVSRVAPLAHRRLPVTESEYDNASARYLDLPKDSISQRVHDLARKVATAGSDQTDLGKASKIDKYLRGAGNFTYSLQVTPPPKGQEPVDYFLFTSRTGYCEHFADAMIVMLRCVGIPARLVTGFKGGTWNSIGGFFMIRQSDAHSWVEAYVRPYGWVSFDPTGSSEAEREQPTPGVRTQASLWDLKDYLRSAWMRYVVSYDQYRQVEMYHVVRGALWGLRLNLDRMMHGSAEMFISAGSAIRVISFVLVSLISLTSAAFGLFLWSRRRRHVPNAVKFYDAMLRLFRSKGLHRAPSVTPVEFAGQAAEMFPDCGALVSEITDQFCLVRYGGHSLDHVSERRLTDLVQQLKRKTRNNHR